MEGRLLLRLKESFRMEFNRRGHSSSDRKADSSRVRLFQQEDNNHLKGNKIRQMEEVNPFRKNRLK